MATYLILANFTDQGLRSVKDTVKRADAVKKAAKEFGVNMREIFWTQGQYDIALIAEADSPEALTSFGLSVGSAGNVRMQTLRAFSRDEMATMLGRLP